MYFPTADIHTNPLVPPLVALVISFFTSMGGVSGAFLLLPFQMSALGYVNPSVSSTNQLYNVFANPGAIVRYSREGRMIWPLSWLLMVGSVPGVLTGALIRITLLPDPRLFKLFVAFVLFGIAFQMLFKHANQRSGGVKRSTAGRAVVLQANRRHIHYRFADRNYTVPVPATLALSFGIGIIGGAYGIGGGAILSPFLVSLMGLPVHTVAGSTLFATCLTSAVGVGFYLLLAPFFPHLSVIPDWRMALLLSAGGFVGMYMGARCQKYVPARFIRRVLMVVLIGTGLLYLLEFFKLL